MTRASCAARAVSKGVGSTQGERGTDLVVIKLEFVAEQHRLTGGTCQHARLSPRGGRHRAVRGPGPRTWKRVKAAPTRRSSSRRASTALDFSSLGGCSVLSARCTSPGVTAENVARSTRMDGLASLTTLTTSNAMFSPSRSQSSHRTRACTARVGTSVTIRGRFDATRPRTHVAASGLLFERLGQLFPRVLAPRGNEYADRGLKQLRGLAGAPRSGASRVRTAVGIGLAPCGRRGGWADRWLSAKSISIRCPDTEVMTMVTCPLSEGTWMPSHSKTLLYCERPSRRRDWPRPSRAARLLATLGFSATFSTFIAAEEWCGAAPHFPPS